MIFRVVATTGVICYILKARTMKFSKWMKIIMRTKMDEATVRKIASTFKSRGELHKKRSYVYTRCVELGILDEVLPRLTNKWMKEKLIEVASKYEYKADFLEANPTAYAACKKYGVLDIVFTRGRRPCSKYTYEVCREIASHFNSKVAFKRGKVSAYDRSVEMGWIDEFAKDFNYISTREAIAETVSGTYKKNGAKYWSDDELIAVAKQYTRLIDFTHNAPREYSVALRRGLVPTFTWLERAEFIDGYAGDTIYAYEFSSTNHAYVGRTDNMNRRHREHLDKKHPDTVMRYALSNGLEVPEPKVLVTGLTTEEGKLMEGVKLDEYRNNGWGIINRAKPGSTGMLGRGLSVAQAMERSRKYEYVFNFMKDDRRAYEVLRRKGKIRECTWLKYKMCDRMPHGYWNSYDRCFDEAKKYVNMHDFREQSNAAYMSAKRHKWLNDYTWLDIVMMSPGTWDNYENCLNAAKECRTRSEFMRTKPGAYNGSIKNGWYDGFIKMFWPDKAKSSGGCFKPVIQIDTNGNVVETFKALKYASYKTGISYSKICMACRGLRKTAGGFIWKYAKVA